MICRFYDESLVQNITMALECMSVTPIPDVRSPPWLVPSFFHFLGDLHYLPPNVSAPHIVVYIEPSVYITKMDLLEKASVSASDGIPQISYYLLLSRECYLVGGSPNECKRSKTTKCHHAHQRSLDSDFENRARLYQFP